MRLPHNPISRSLPLLALLAASGCASSVEIPPPVADLKAVTEAKPVPGNDIVTSQKAADDYSAAVEGWGDRISAAGGRLCRWTERTYKVHVGCPNN